MKADSVLRMTRNAIFSLKIICTLREKNDLSEMFTILPFS